LGGRVLSGLSQDSCAPRLIFLDEIHPETFYASVLACSPEDTAIITISKSGETAETLCQLLAIFQHFLPPQQAAHFFVLTEDRDSPLQTIAKTYGFTCFALPRDIGGRFSVLSLTGLFPALIAGVDETLLLKGARHLLRSAMEREPSLVRSLVFAAHAAQNKRHQVLLSYDVRFAPLALWQRQLWAESLGKNRKGTTPITAQGTIDQHSQLQLYLDGARDKVFTFLSVQQEDTRLLFDVTNVEARLKYLKRRTMGDLLAAECQATYDALRTKTLPVRHFAIEAFDPASIGALLAYFMCEVIVVGTILGVNPFDQPAVEHIKVRTREILS
jgi:glucose-6-phosphate isomerase